MGDAIKKTVSLLFVFALLSAGAAFGQAREKPVTVGDLAPDFTLTDQNGQKRSLSAERGKRPVVLIFYRGHW
jgi:cytochrome oxidase Cu insertion factor (SCO1/SenC/PrrC family)